MTDGGSYRHLAALAHAGRRLARAATQEDAIGMVAQVAVEALGGHRATIGRIEHARGLLRILCHVGDLGRTELQHPVDETYPLLEIPQLTQAPERATAWAGDRDEPDLPAPLQALLHAPDQRSLLLLPLVVDGAMWGMLSVVRGGDQPSFSAEDLALGEALGGLVGASLGRMEDRNELHALAYRDALTGLGNRRAVDDRLEGAFAPDRLARPVAVVLCDVNGLKAVNDEHGHDAGDRLLQEVSLLLSAEAGRLPGALAARLGGDEFCLVAEGVAAVDLEAIATRLAEGAAALRRGEGLACGWALADRRPGEATTAVAAARALLRLADAAQYRVKRDGRDGAPSPVTGPVAAGSDVGAEVVERALRGLRSAGPTMLERLTAVTTAMHEVLDAAVWAVGWSADGGPVTILRALDRPGRTRSGVPDLRPGTTIDAAVRPAIGQALGGGTFHASLLTGDEVERGVLAAGGYVEVLAAGRTLGTDGWLVEIIGDALSRPLIALEPLLRLLVEVAVAAPVEELSSARSDGSSA